MLNEFFLGATPGGPGPGPIGDPNGLRFNSANSSHLSRTPSSAGNSRTFTWSGWVKQVVVSGTAQTHILAAGTNPYFQFYFAGPTLFIETSLGYIQPTQKFRDPSAWYHFVVAVDTTQATATNRIRFYVNGEEVTDFATDQRSSITQNADLSINSAVEHRIGTQTAGSAYSNMYLSEVHFVDGTQLAASDFGGYDNNNVWQPKSYTGTFGTNGAYLDFSDPTNIGKDAAGSNDWTPVNLLAEDVVSDSPTNNFCTLNPNDINGSPVVFSNGNLSVMVQSTSALTVGTFGVSSGKWYWEVVTNSNQLHAAMTGIADLREIPIRRKYGGPAGLHIYQNNGSLWGEFGGSFSNTDYADGWSDTDIVGVALDMDAGNVSFSINGTDYGVANTSSLLGYLITPVINSDSNAVNATFNFGQKPFAYPVEGFNALCSANLPEPSVPDGSTAMDVALYDGDGTDNRQITVNHGTDLAWVKARNQSDNHMLADVVRGPDEILFSNHSLEAYNEPNSISAFNSTGFQVGSRVGTAQPNQSGFSYVAWSWDAGSSNTSISPGGLNSSVYNQSQNWSGGSVVGDTNAGGTWDAAFDGAFGTGAFTYATNTSTLTMPSNTTWSNKFEVYALKYGGTLYVNGTDVGASMTGFTSTAQWHDITSIVGSSGTLSSIGISDVSTNYVKLFAVRLDGKLLVDSGESVANVPALASTVRANPSAGFSIVGYTGSGSAATIGHGLNAAPEFIIVKNRDTARPWSVFHQSIPNMSSGYINLNSAAAFTGGYAGVWNGTDPTNAVFSVGTDNESNNSGDDFIAYCWAPVEGYSAFGSYTGNGLTDGAFVYTGFRPKWLLLKHSTDAYHWYLFDTSRDTGNVAGTALIPNDSFAETSDPTNYGFDFLSNGFKLRNSNARSNGSGVTYIYAAFAEHPFSQARAR